MLILEYILFGYFAMAIMYALTLSLAGRFIKRKVKKVEGVYNKIAVMIPAYKEDAVIITTAEKALKQDYPSNAFDVVVIADQLKDETIKKLEQMEVELIKVSFTKSTKVKSLNAAMTELENHYSIAVILDADNIMEPDFLQKINGYYNAGHTVIQGKRIAKNTNTSFAILDALSECINNHIYRKGHHALDLCVSLIGSGMAFDYGIFKKNLNQMNSVGGFDRELECRLLAKGHKAIYVEDAVVYDEKIEQAQTFSNQRRRWISSQFIYLKRFFIPGTKALFQGNIAYFNSTVLRNIMLPRVIILGLTFIFACVFTLLSSYVTVNPLLWWTLLAANLTAFIIAVPKSFYNKEFFKALAYVPQAFSIMFMLLFKMKGANTQFIHTPHAKAEADHKLSL